MFDMLTTPNGNLQASAIRSFFCYTRYFVVHTYIHVS
jgi:hypothetical protein